MPLFDTKEKNFTEDVQTEAIKVPTEQQILRVSGRYLSMKTAIGDIEPNSTIHFITAGSWSMHDLLAYVLRYTGPADVRCFTFAWGPDATRTAINLRNAGTIRHLWIALHSVMKKWTVSAMQIMEKYCEKISLIPLHAKGFIVENENWRVSVIGSANFSNNQCIEGGVITTDRNVYDMHRRWLDSVFESGETFIGDQETEILAETPPVEFNDKILFLIRGLPGSGKSSLAHIIADEVYENDDRFNLNGKYKFDQEQLSWAKAECYSHCRDAMERGVKKIGIANTFCDQNGLDQYYRLAKIFGYSVFTIVTENRNGTTNIHGVPPEVIARMQKKFKVKLC